MNKMNMAQAETIVGGCKEVCEVVYEPVMSAGQIKCFHVSVCKDKNGAVVSETWVPTNLNLCGIGG